MRKVMQIDDSGFFEEDIILNDDEQTPKNCIEVDVPEGLYHPKWNGTEWVEGLSQEEIDAIKNQTPEPSAEERIAELEQENILLKAQNKALTDRTNFHEEVLTEIILTVMP